MVGRRDQPPKAEKFDANLTHPGRSDNQPRQMSPSARSHPVFGKAMRKEEFFFADGHNPLNHGSYGTYPRSVHAAKLEWQELAERRPDWFMRKKYMHQLNKCRQIVANVINADTSDCVFVANATTGVNEILRSLQWNSGDAILYYSTAYGINSFELLLT